MTVKGPAAAGPAPKKGAAGGKEAANNKKAKKADQYNARMQWIITNRMRRILIDQLHYLPEEVRPSDLQVPRPFRPHPHLLC